MKTKIFLLAALLICMGGCAADPAQSTLHYGAFDTVIQIHAPLPRKELDTLCETAFRRFDELSRLFDIYYGYTGIVNLYDVNRKAALEPVEVPEEILRLLEWGIEAHAATEGRVNIAMGAVLILWHEAREEQRLPDPERLSRGLEHCDIGDLIIDRGKGTVYFADPALSLDVGAIAKGWACERVAEELTALGYENFLISAGGNIVARGHGQTEGLFREARPWRVGIQDPLAEVAAVLTALEVGDGAVVTSGDYQRYIEVDGLRYHHIIDPATGYPARCAKSVSVIARDSGLADMMSTALFLTSAEEAAQWADRMEIGVLIVTEDGGTVKNVYWPE